MRRLTVLLTLLAGLALVPAAAQAAAPGVNIAGIATPADLDQAAATGAKFVRVFAPRNVASDYATFKGIVTGARARGLGVVFVLTGAPDGSTTPPDPADFATFAGRFAAQMASAGGATAYEVWNEEDETQFWAGTPDPARYAAILKAAYPAIKAADPNAKVLLGPLTGNNYGYLQSLYDHGVAGSFDAASVHTDTACLVDPPSSFYREDGKVARFTFLGFRTVHDVMAANGDGAKPIWMTELGWTTTTSTCARGMWAGKKRSGVDEAAQAANLKEAYHCLAGYPYLEVGLWFTLKDTSGNGDELDHYGLQRLDGSHKQSWDAFHTVATQGDTLTGPCGDFDPPAITVSAPTAGLRFAGALLISAAASDTGSGLGRITFRVDGRAQALVNFTKGLANGKPVTLNWLRARKLANGPHTLSIEAIDLNGNASSQTVTVTKVDPRQLAATLKTRVDTKKLTCRGRTCTLRGRVRGPKGVSLDGKVRVEWQWRTQKGRFKKIHGGLRNARRPFTFRQRLKRGGRWRVKVVYLGQPPLKKSTSALASFRVR